MNKLLNERYVAVEGLDNALEMAKALIKNDYQVMVQLDDCDIYIVAFTENTTEFGDKFTPLSFEEIDAIEDMRASNDNDKDSFWQDEYDKLLEEYDKLSCEHEDLLENYNKLVNEDDEDDDDFDDDDEDFDDDEDDFDDEEDED